MREQIEALRRLQDLDRRIGAARSELAEAPDLIAKRKKELEAKRAQAEARRAGVKARKRDCEAKERELKSLQGDIDKTQVQLNQAKSNEEYSGLLKKIEQIKAHVGAIEEETLLLYEAIEQEEAKLSGLPADVAKAEGDFASFARETSARSSARESELRDLEAQRATLAEIIPGETLSLYERTFEHHKERALAAVVDGICQGCFVEIIPNQQAILHGGHSMVTCKRCGRILFIEGV